MQYLITLMVIVQPVGWLFLWLLGAQFQHNTNLDDLQLNTLVCRRSIETPTYRLDDAIYESLPRRRTVRGVSRQVAIRN